MKPEFAAQLKDIHGLDTVSWWPPAVGWWLLAAALAGLVLGLFLLLRHLRRYPPGSWHRDAWRQLRRLRQQSSSLPADQLAGELSVLMRRIAVARCGRDQAAALAGERWLDWLQRNDPAGFDWTVRGKPLLTLPYAPAGLYAVSSGHLLPLIDAAFAWTGKHTRPRHV